MVACELVIGNCILSRGLWVWSRKSFLLFIHII
jgi:hypothetical protein